MTIQTKKKFGFTGVGTVSALALSLAVLGACGDHNEVKTVEVTDGVQVPATAVETTTKDSDYAEASAPAGELIPPAPGEEGGLPDDREPLPDSPENLDPATLEGAGLALQEYAAAIEAGNFTDAYTYWSADDAVDEDDFIEDIGQYSEVRVLTGRPAFDNDEGDEAIVPVQIYGREADGTPFNMIGEAELKKSETGEWMITEVDLDRKGEITVVVE